MQLIGTVGLASLFAGSPSKRNGSASLPTCLAEREIVHLRDGWRSIEKLPKNLRADSADRLQEFPNPRLCPCPGECSFGFFDSYAVDKSARGITVDPQEVYSDIHPGRIPLDVDELQFRLASTRPAFSGQAQTFPAKRILRRIRFFQRIVIHRQNRHN